MKRKVSAAETRGEFVPGSRPDSVPHGLTNIENGAALHWKTPLPGLMIGASDSRKNTGHAPATAGDGAYPGTATVTATNIPQYFAKYEKDKLMVASEFERARTTATSSFGAFTENAPVDYRAFYGMASYKLTERLTSGVYYSQFFDKQVALGPARYQKDWAISARYDFNQFLYAKAEEQRHGAQLRRRPQSRRPKAHHQVDHPQGRRQLLIARKEKDMKRRLLAILFVAAATLFASHCSAQVIIANNSVRASYTSKSELKEVFTGSASSIGGSHVTPVLLKEGAVEDEFLAAYIGKANAEFVANWRSLVFSGQAPVPKSLNSDAAVVEYVAHNPGAIGYIGRSSPHEGVKVIPVR